MSFSTIVLLILVLLPVLPSASAPAADDWVTVTSKEQGFRVEFPAAYDLSEDEQSPYPVQAYSCIDGDFSYTLSCMPNPIPDTGLEEMTNGFIEEMVALYGTWAEVRKHRRIKLGGNPGVELVISVSYGEGLPDIIVKQRLYFADGRYFILSASYTADRKDRSEVRRFFRSFKLLE
ncbi:hypothetical protein JXM67_11815 [candidate division WOR-3 bacterium]|nr:hypothetical protein [candidate division WOR-3 bacterium]